MKSLTDYLSGFSAAYTAFEKKNALALYRPRDPFSNKGSFGHVLLLAGSYGKIGAAVIAGKACLAAGAGLLTTYLPGCGYDIMQTSLPESMVGINEDDFHLSSHPEDLDRYQSAGVGPGIGTDEDTALMLKSFIARFEQPLVIDADALNIISAEKDILDQLHPDTIITPHPKEFDRLFGLHATNFSRYEKAHAMAIQYQIILVLKGHFTGIFYPDGQISFNTSGNAGMAKGGSGDALTGIISALLAQSYAPKDAAALGVYLHGYAGDLAAVRFSEEAMLPSDLIHCIGKTFLDWKSDPIFKN